jgi:hypothetical protein
MAFSVDSARSTSIWWIARRTTSQSSKHQRAKRINFFVAYAGTDVWDSEGDYLFNYRLCHVAR